MDTETDYVLGTHDEEILRLGTQHQVWRAFMLDAWTRAGITRGSRVVDFGAGPGYATCDAAEVVGRRGHVTAIERSPVFLAHAQRQLQRRDPTSERHESFVNRVMASWRTSGGEPNIVPSLLPLMGRLGLQLIEVRPLIFSIRPSHFAWQWPASFIVSNSHRLVELGQMPREEADALRGEWHALGQNPDAVMITPLVLEIIAKKR